MDFIQGRLVRENTSKNTEPKGSSPFLPSPTQMRDILLRLTF